MFQISVEIHISDSEASGLLNDDLKEDDLRSRIKENRKRKMDNGNDELQLTKDALSKVQREMEAMRAEKAEMRDELERMKRDLLPVGSLALGFVPSTFMAMNFTKAQIWVADQLTSEMKKEMLKFPKYFEFMNLLGDARGIGFKTCIRFNRGEDCPNMWHVHTRPKKGSTGYRKELRLHCCALCASALGTVAGHHLLACPWLDAKTWRDIESNEERV